VIVGSENRMQAEHLLPVNKRAMFILLTSGSNCLSTVVFLERGYQSWQQFW
jgi:hypothetical protein